MSKVMRLHCDVNNETISCKMISNEGKVWDEFIITPGNPPKSGQTQSSPKNNYTIHTINDQTTYTINDHTTNTINRYTITIIIIIIPLLIIIIDSGGYTLKMILVL